ncbi:hypothetical protein Bca4012_065287 [Brassica carinata]|uniref:Uncharacterized protein n=1 Tax=Brassica carinata TaxID=52824 RepID=A0A8X7VNJ6_BRACI|nr:hypothetical protein Bca52824_017698 [Brassica carinata]
MDPERPGGRVGLARELIFERLLGLRSTLQHELFVLVLVRPGPIKNQSTAGVLYPAAEDMSRFGDVSRGHPTRYVGGEVGGVGVLGTYDVAESAVVETSFVSLEDVDILYLRR